MTCRSSRVPTALLAIALAACGGAPSQPAAPAPSPAATPVTPDPAATPPSDEPAPAPPAGPGKKRPTEPGPHQTTYGAVFNFRPDGGGSGKRIYLAGTFNGWKPSDAAYLLRDDDGDGTWSITIKLPAGTYQYKYVIDGTTWIKDPYAPGDAPDGFGGRNGQFDVQ
jgi:hypothetical protein